MSVNYTQVEAVRDGNSTVYGITLEVDGILCEAQPEAGEEEIPAPQPRIFRLQIVDDVEDKATAFQQWLDQVVAAVREERNPTPPPSLAEILGGQQGE